MSHLGALHTPVGPYSPRPVFAKATQTWIPEEDFLVPSAWGQLNVRMRIVAILLLFCLCRAAEPRKSSPGVLRSQGNPSRSHGRGGRRGSSPVKRYAPGLPCDVYTYLHEKYLDCQERKLVYVLPDWPQDLLHMLLARNKIRVLKNNMFAKFKRLKSLDLQQNEISKIESEAFFGLNKLTTLLLQHNQIKVLTEEAFIYTPLLSYLRLYDNPWHCTCELETLISMLQIPRNRNLGNYAKCGSPPALRNKKLLQLKPQELCDEEEKEQLDPKPQVSGIPAVIRPEADSTLCHNYVFPIQTLDCKRKGEPFCLFCFCRLLGKVSPSLQPKVPEDAWQEAVSDSNGVYRVQFRAVGVTREQQKKTYIGKVPG